MDTEIKQGDFITLLPGTIIQFYEQKENVCLGFLGFSSHGLNGVNLIQSTLSSFSNRLEYPVLAVNPTVASYFKDYFALWARITTGHYPPDTKMAQSTVSYTHLDVYKRQKYGWKPPKEEKGTSPPYPICR